jgi:hypothetical protein
MTRFIMGVVAGLVLGVVATSYAADIVGTGKLVGWTVVQGSDDICSDPAIDTSARSITCE